MIEIDREQIKKRQEIFNLTFILFTEHTVSKKIKSKISELKSIFKLTKKILKERINQIDLTNNETTKNEIKKQICTEIKNLIVVYNNKNRDLTETKLKEKKNIREKMKILKIELKNAKYYDLKDDKDIIIQIIQEKKNLYKQLLLHIEYQKDIFFLFQQKYFYYFDNFYDVYTINFENDKKKEEKIKKYNKYFEHKKKKIKKQGDQSIILMKQELKNDKINIDKYIVDKGFIFNFENNQFKEKYEIEIEIVDKYDYSSDSSDDSNNNFEKDDINFSNNSSFGKNDFLNGDKILIDEKNNYKNDKKKNLKKVHFLDNSKNIEGNKLKNFIYSDKKQDKTNLINKLVEIKEKYNQLINEKYELEFRKKKIRKKIKEVKAKIFKISNKSTSGIK